MMIPIPAAPSDVTVRWLADDSVNLLAIMCWGGHTLCISFDLRTIFAFTHPLFQDSQMTPYPTSNIFHCYPSNKIVESDLTSDVVS